MPFFRYNAFFSDSEKLVVLMLLMTLIAGSGVKIYKSVFARGSTDIQAIKQLDDFEKNLLKIISEETVQKKTQQKKIRPGKRTDGNYKSITLDINRATKEDFEQLPRIGPVIAQRIVDYRDSVGRIRSINELIEVKGIGIKTLNKLSPYLKIVN